MKKRLISAVLSLVLVMTAAPFVSAGTVKDAGPDNGYSVEKIDGDTLAVSGDEAHLVEITADPSDWDKVTNPSATMGGPSFNSYNPIYTAEGGYGGQLTEDQKWIYDCLVEEYVDSKGLPLTDTRNIQFTIPGYQASSSSQLQNIVQSDFLNAYFAFYFDHPEVFWAGGVSMSYSWTNSGSRYYVYQDKINLTINDAYSGARNKVWQYRNGVEAAVKTMCTYVGDLKLTSFYKAAHDWVCNNASYNYNEVRYPGAYPESHTSGNMFAGNHMIVCDGYSKSYKVLIDQLRIRYGLKMYAVEVVGNGVTSSGSESHMWNYVLLNNKWYAVDTTWDDQSVIYYDYFLAGKNTQGFNWTFGSEHVQNYNFCDNASIWYEYPALSSDKFSATGTSTYDPKGFIDVPAGSYFETPVNWAVSKGITKGTSNIFFGSDDSCTRAQAVTFLWRAQGSPTVYNSKQYADVPKGSYYEMAVKWADQKGITKGTSDTMFSPDAVCNRAQIVTFLSRLDNAGTVSMSNPFTDVKRSDYFYNPVLWAYKNNITQGTTATLFSPDASCTRAQIVTFLYRYKN